MSVAKTERNAEIRKLSKKHGGKLSYREIQRRYNFKTVTTVWRIVNRS